MNTYFTSLAHLTFWPSCQKIRYPLFSPSLGGGDRMKNGSNENQRQSSDDGSNAPEIA